MKFKVKYVENIQSSIDKIHFFEVDAIDSDEAREKIDNLFDVCAGYVEDVEEIEC